MSNIIENRDALSAEQSHGSEPPSSAREVLIAARKRIENLRDWYGGGCSPRNNDGRKCAQTAISAVADYNNSKKAAYIALLKAAGITGVVGSDLWGWNDAPERTHAEVLAAFDKAIAECSA